MTHEELIKDVAYARALAEEGRHAPLLGGAYLLFWGLLNAAAFVAHWAILMGAAPDIGAPPFAVLWMSYGAVATVGMFLLRSRTRTKPGLGSVGARAEQSIWNGSGIVLVAIVIGSIARMALDQDATAPNAIFGAAFAIYGAALFGVAKLSGHAWLSSFAFVSAATAGLLCAFANEPWAYLLAATGAFAVLALPGLILLRREPAALA